MTEKIEQLGTNKKVDKKLCFQDCLLAIINHVPGWMDGWMGGWVNGWE